MDWIGLLSHILRDEVEAGGIGQFGLRVRAAARPYSALIPKIGELQSHWKLLRPQGGDHRLKFIPAFAGDADLLVLDLCGHLEFPVAD